ncbi:cysteine desulfurase family protein [Mariniplasma anaerobium]|uniref:cysteine desulfurase n=1 Tax=Mariniplasma anaerobium TaxID=2735436 RepID=A0A7U9TGL7_9MOLU|nr:cysteine desulfurase family protein [Mariniplasma anaerobium]BCR35775.1 cysteine desulfurase IscS [Mariniplasma anaerobium]
MKEFYLDYAATTPLDNRVLDFMKPFLEHKFENPSSMHSHAIENKKAINQARKKVADALNASPDEIFFTSGGTESTNWAIKGYAFKNPDKREIITSKIEHKATLNTLHFLETQGYKVTYLDVDAYGLIDLKQLDQAINENTLMVSIIYSNNEIGTIQDVRSISKICRRHQTKLHLDAVQAFAQLDIDLQDLDVDFLTISSHKFYGPKGVGVLYVKKGLELEPLIHGGSQESKQRGGTENLYGVVGMGEAARIARLELEKNRNHYQMLQIDFHQKMMNAFDDIKLNGTPCGSNRSYNNLSYAFKHVLGHEFHFQLNKLGVFISNGSACNAQSIEPTHVIKAINVEKEYQPCVIRISFGKYCKLEDHDEIIKRFKQAYDEIRN